MMEDLMVSDFRFTISILKFKKESKL